MELLRHWSESGRVQTDLLLTSANRDIFDGEARSLGARLHYLKYGRSELATFIQGFRKLLRERCYDAIHDHADYASGWRYAIAAGLLPRTRVTHVHNPWLHIEANYANSSSRRLTSAIGKKLVVKYATHVCGTSQEILSQYGFVPGTAAGPSVRALHCGIDVAKFNRSDGCERQSVCAQFGWPLDVKLVLFVGRLDRAIEIDHPQNHKNSWFALNVARVALQRDRGIRLLMAGGGEARTELERRIDDWGLRERLRLIGIRRDIQQLMHASDVLLFPSRQEGLGMIAVEAQAAGLPVLASTAVPREAIVVPELYDSVPLEYGFEHWANALLHRIAKPRPSTELCREAFEKSDFNIVNSSRKLEEIYASGNSAEC